MRTTPSDTGHPLRALLGGAGADHRFASLAPSSQPRVIGSRQAAMRRLPLAETLALIRLFWATCRAPTSGQRVLHLLESITELVQLIFATVEELRPKDAALRATNAKCLADLETARGHLTGDDLPPAGEIAHAMDGVIVQLLHAEDAMADLARQDSADRVMPLIRIPPSFRLPKAKRLA